MKHRNLGYFCVGVALLSLTACAQAPFDRASAADSTAADTPVEQESPTPESGETGISSFPDTKVSTINTSGEVREVELQLLKEESVSLAIYAPSHQFQEEAIRTNGGHGVRLYYRPNGDRQEDTYLEIIFPDHQSQRSTIQNMIMGDRGLLSQNQWTIVDRTSVVTYPWALEKIVYQHSEGSTEFGGVIFQGENRLSDRESEFFYVYTHYPMENAQAFEVNVALILENIEFFDDFF